MYERRFHGKKSLEKGNSVGYNKHVKGVVIR